MTHMSSLQVLNAVCSSVRSFLGPDQRIKYILEDEDEDSRLISSCVELLSNLDVKHPVGHVALEAGLAHQKAHGTGTTTMMTMAGLWSTEMRSLLTQGIPMPAVIKYGDECIEKCLASLETMTVPCAQITNNPNLSRTQKFSDVAPQDGGDPSSIKELHKTHEHPGGQNVLVESSDRGYRVGQSKGTSGRDLGASEEQFDSRTEKLLVPDDKVDQFVEVQFSNQRPNHSSVFRPTESESDANLAEIDPQRNPVSGLVADDEISWFFERDSGSSGYSLEHHASDCQALLKAFDEKLVKDKSYSSFLRETSTLIPKERTQNDVAVRQHSQDDSDGEFDSCFPVEEQEAILKFSTEHFTGIPAQHVTDDEFDCCFPVEGQDSISKFSTENTIGKPAQDVTDDEFDSCFPVEGQEAIPKFSTENAIGKPAQDVKDEEFDSCFPIEESAVSQEIMRETTTKGNISHAKLSICEQSGDLDSFVSTESLDGDYTATQVVHVNSRPAISDPVMCNNDFSTQKPTTGTNNSTAMQESIENLLQASRDKLISKSLASVQNNSRHFRSIETVIDQHICDEQSSTSGRHSNKATSEVIKTEKNNRLEHKTTASQKLPKIDTDSYQISPLTSTNLNSELPDNVGNEIDEVVENLLKARTKQAAVRRLANIQINSRHFRTTETVAGHNDSEKVDSISSQESNLKVSRPAPEVSEEYQTMTSSRNDRSQEPRHFLDGIQNRSRHLQHDRHLQCVDLPSETYMSTSADGQEPDIAQMGHRLSHRADLEMGLVIEAFQMQREYQEEKENTPRIPDLNRLAVCTIAGPPVSNSHLQTCVLVPIDPCQRSAIVETEGKYLRALLVNGDATSTFRHAGYQNKVKVTQVKKWTELAPVEDKTWLGQTTTLLQELDVKLLVLKGRAEEHLVHHCLSKKILLLENVPYKTLLALGEACTVSILTYLADATVDDTAGGITVACWESGWVGGTRVRSEVVKRKVFAKISVAGQLLQTAILCHPMASLLPTSEARFWTCAHRLQGAIGDDQCLPGAGLPEQTAIKQLLGMIESNLTAGIHGNLSCYKEAILSAFAEGFVLYLVQVLRNMGNLDNISQAKALIMSGLQKDKLEPVLSGSIQSEPQQQNLCESLTVSGKSVSEHASNSSDCGWLEPDQSGNSQSCVADAKADCGPICKEANIKPAWTETKHACSSLETVALGARVDAARPNQDGKRSLGERNREGCDESRMVYDSYAAKRAAWENAWVLVKTVLRIDAHIVTGLEKPGQPGSCIQIDREAIL